ncbi:MAG: hypothetical protein GXO87_08955 [Chlorobi bacterium]|nr:hypothetical protein [Chlorobiota bacterium]
MSKEKTRELINRYFDAELSKEEEIFLFASLSEDEKGREYFKTLAALNEAINRTHEEFPENLDDKILQSLAERKTEAVKGKSFVSPPALFAYAVSVILIIFILMFKSDLNNYKKELQAQASVVNRQNKMIELLFNALPAATVQAERKTQIVVTPQL